jgi:hypothetical protein
MPERDEAPSATISHTSRLSVYKRTEAHGALDAAAGHHAHMLAPLPRWATTTLPAASSGATNGNLQAMYS